MEEHCFTRLCWFLPYNNPNQPKLYKCFLILANQSTSFLQFCLHFTDVKTLSHLCQTAGLVHVELKLTCWSFSPQCPRFLTFMVLTFVTCWAVIPGGPLHGVPPLLPDISTPIWKDYSFVVINENGLMILCVMLGKASPPVANSHSFLITLLFWDWVKNVGEGRQF